MAEAEKVEEVVEEPVEEKQEEEHKFSETEEEALAKGWNPDGVEGKRALSAEEYLDRQPLYDDLRKRGKQIRQLMEDNQTLKSNDQKFAQRLYEMARKDLQKEKKAALDDGDNDKVMEADDEIRKLDKEQESYSQPQQQDTGAQEAFNEWVSKNPWYQNDSDLASYADGAGPRVVQENPHLARTDANGNTVIVDQEEFLNKVAEKTKKTFPDKFKGGTRRKAVEADTGHTGGGSKKKYSIKSIESEEERQVAKRVIESTGMKEEDYMKFYLGES